MLCILRARGRVLVTPQDKFSHFSMCVARKCWPCHNSWEYRLFYAFWFACEQTWLLIALVSNICTWVPPDLKCFGALIVRYCMFKACHSVWCYLFWGSCEFECSFKSTISSRWSIFVPKSRNFEYRKIHRIASHHSASPQKNFTLRAR